MANPSTDLRKGRRRLEEIEEIFIIDDLTWDDEYKCFYIHISIQLDQTYPKIPQKTEWYITIDESYPLGEISIYPSVNNGINSTFPHQSNNYFVAKNNLWRLGKLCVDFNSRTLGIYTPEKESLTADERLYWNAKRCVAWIYCAAKSELTSPGDYFELPDYTSLCTDVFAYNEDSVSMMQWEDTSFDYGIAKICLTSSAPTAYIAKFMSFNEKESVYIPAWGTHMQNNSQVIESDALWIKTSSPLTVNGWQAPMTFEELQRACLAQNINLLNRLKHFAPKARDGRPHLILFGFPTPKHYGDPPTEIVWQALELPVLSYRKYVNTKFQSGKKCSTVQSYGAPQGFRPNEEGWWKNDVSTILTPGLELKWIESQNWNAHTITARGSYPSSILSKRFAVIGAGSLGSIVSELLVRSGVIHLTCVDGDRLKIGNLCRHTLTMSNLTQYKSIALSSRLSEINPHSSIEAVCSYLRMEHGNIISPDISTYDIVIDTTGSDSVLEIIAAGLNWKKTVFLSASVGLGATRLYLYLTRNQPPNFGHFLSFVEPYLDLDRKECDLAELPRDGIGCWNPLFPARADDMWMAACTVIKALERFLLSSDTASICAVYKTKTADNLFYGYTPIEVRYNE